ncbi:MAG: glycosyltransferase family 92 protein [Rhodospirillales bacterium]|nr:glycosyltransferase family 92 protein [Rhodospirillales bacterium]
MAQWFGLQESSVLVLDHPQFTIENLALLSDTYDFVIANRVLHRCENIKDAASETLRVLRSGGLFVHTTSLLDSTLGVPFQGLRSQRALCRLFADADDVLSGGCLVRWPMISWVKGRKAATAKPVVPTVETRRAIRRSYPSPKIRKPTRFGVVAIARNEAPYLLEWIAHYRLLGFERITIYDNESNDASWRILKPLAKAGVIDAVYWKNRRKQHKQQSAYNHARLGLRDSLEWCLFADLDEFLILRTDATLSDILPRAPSVSAVAVPWRIFGSAGQRYRGTGLTIERFLQAASRNSASSKSLVRLSDVQWMGTHWPTLLKGRMIDIAGNDFDPQASAGRIFDGIARLHHYFGRSWEEFQCKRARGRGTGPKGAMRPESIFHELDLNETFNDDALRLVESARAEVARLSDIVKDG